MKDQMKQTAVAWIFRELRKKAGYSQEKVAEWAGLSVRTVQRLEKDGSFSDDTIKAVAEVYKVDSKEIRETAEKAAQEAEAEAKKKFDDQFIVIPLIRLRLGAVLGHVLRGVHMIQPQCPPAMPADVEEIAAEFFDRLNDYLDIYRDITNTELLVEHRAFDEFLGQLEQKGFSVFGGTFVRIANCDGGEPSKMQQGIVLVLSSTEPRIQRAPDGTETVSTFVPKHERLPFL